ncbi:MAG TPA: hypothetical protein PLV04_02825 [Phenylobacterium sp.]|nr:hypothetical protein [Phenylobacterium sp.]HQN50018.1 hypothetical protein [Phenylobacterium sp.]
MLMQTISKFHFARPVGFCPMRAPKTLNTSEYTQINNNASKDAGAMSAAGSAEAFGSLAQLKGG